ncbi:alpha/beta fold hydrolase [Saccharopolyspora pogona]|uniref:alpha/beta fold hydrolase n=1 Tax=Saccharopolyspora pogona TaxID=333966 RepID=UPI0016823EEA|nr:alpha/beta hydrolase [Saccharopolyspora pogona]
MDLRALEDHRHTVSTSSGDVSYFDMGQGPAALFVHGVGTNAALWRHVIEACAGRRRCIALDLPLHGRSAAREDQDLTLGGLASVLGRFCDALELDTVDLVANDTGGAIAQVFAVREPGRLRTLALTNCDTHDNLPPEAFRPVVELAGAGQLAQLGIELAGNVELIRGSAFGQGYEHPERVDDEVLHGYVRPVLGTLEAGREFERLLVSLTAADLMAIEPGLTELTVPTLVVWGTGDQNFALRWAYWLRDTIPGATEVVEVQGGKLFFPEERPRDLVPHLLRFWDENTSR